MKVMRKKQNHSDLLFAPSSVEFRYARADKNTPTRMHSCIPTFKVQLRLHFMVSAVLIDNRMMILVDN